MSSKNNPENRGRVQEVKKFDSKPVKPTFYFGRHKGHGNYMAAQYENGDIVIPKGSDRPIPYKNI